MTALPRESQGIVYWHKKWSVSVSIRSIPLRLPLNARAARKSDGRKTVSVSTPCLSLWERWPAGSEDGEGQITATSIGKCWHLRRQMTSRGRKALSVTCGDSSPRESQGIVYWHKKWSVSVSIRSIHLFYGYPSMRVPPESRMVVKRFPSPAPLASPCGRGGQRSEDGRGQITATSIGKCWHLRRQMTSRGRKALSVTCGDSSPKGRAKASYIGTRNGAYLYRYAPFTVLRLPLNARAARKSDGRKTVSVPAPLASPCGRGGPQRGRRGQITATSNRKMLAPSQADDVPRAQGPLSHLR